MSRRRYAAFADELGKIANAELADHAIELGGLGILAAPHLYNLVTGKKPSHKTERNAELLGLGVLGGPSAYKIGKHLFKKAAPAGAPGLGKLQGLVVPTRPPGVPPIAKLKPPNLFTRLGGIGSPIQPMNAPAKHFADLSQMGQASALRRAVPR